VANSQTAADQLPKPLVLSVNGIAPKIAESVFLAPGCVIAGDVEIGPESSVWFGVVMRGDVAPIRIGVRTNVQDGAVLHVDTGTPCVLGDDVTIGHRAIVHGSNVGNRVLIGMGSIVLSRSTIGEGAVIAAGAVVAEDTDVQPGALMMGVPAKEKRILESERQERMAKNAAHYVVNARRYASTMALVQSEKDGGSHGG
jgi:carbonic anhydrase/acetyltransferase-like protein (isoleucine patch superfamily)